MDAITARAKNDGTTVSSSLSDTDLNAAAQAASGKDVAFVFITADSGYIIVLHGCQGCMTNVLAERDTSPWRTTLATAMTSMHGTAGYVCVILLNISEPDRFPPI